MICQKESVGLERDISNRLAGVTKCNQYKRKVKTQPFEVEKIKIYFLMHKKWCSLLKESAALQTEIKFSYAFSNLSISNFFICINACITRWPFSGSLINLPSMEGTICHDTPYLSFSQPHILSCPPLAVRLFQ